MQQVSEAVVGNWWSIKAGILREVIRTPQTLRDLLDEFSWASPPTIDRRVRELAAAGYVQRKGALLYPTKKAKAAPVQKYLTGRKRA